MTYKSMMTIKEDIMKQVPVYHIDAFTTKSFGGNPAGVVPDSKILSEEEMQQIATELNLSESAFLTPASHPHADY
jgi:trans-2,3-dihydro-3-hydroxyanthranilate isomerase